MPLENKCPLCGKVNPNTEWYCEACGAKLPLQGNRAATQAESGAKPARPQVAPNAPVSVAKTPVSPAVLVAIGAVVLVLLVLFNLAINRPGASGSTVAATSSSSFTPPSRNTQIPASAPASAPAVAVAAPRTACSTGITAVCADGSTWDAPNHRGACSGHGGVAQWCR